MSTITKLQRLATLRMEEASIIDSMDLQLQQLTRQIDPSGMFIFCVHDNYEPIRVSAFSCLDTDISAQYELHPNGLVVIIEYNAGIAAHLPKIKSILETWINQTETA